MQKHSFIKLVLLIDTFSPSFEIFPPCVRRIQRCTKVGTCSSDVSRLPATHEYLIDSSSIIFMLSMNQKQHRWGSVPKSKQMEEFFFWKQNWVMSSEEKGDVLQTRRLNIFLFPERNEMLATCSMKGMRELIHCFNWNARLVHATYFSRIFAAGKNYFCSS